MISYMTKLELLPEPYMIFRFEKLPLIYAACFALSLSFVDPYERFVMLVKSRSRVYHPHMHYSYTGGRRNNMLSIQIHLKIFYSYTGSKHQKYSSQDIHQINTPSSCCYLLKVFVAERQGDMQKLFIKKEEMRKKMWASVRDI